MALLESLDLLTGFILGILHRLTDLVPPLVCLVRCDVLARLSHFFGSVFSVAPQLPDWLVCRFRGLLPRFALPFRQSAQPCRQPDPYSLFASLSPQMRLSSCA